MNTYLILKSVLMLAALVAAFGIFFKRTRHLYRIMMAVEGENRPLSGRMSDRIRILVTDVLGQTNVRREFIPGMAHMMIFFGFLAIQPHSLELMIRGICPAFEIGSLMPGVYKSYLFIADILAFLVLLGFGYALYRRLVIRPSYLTMGRDANLIILFTSVIVLSFHFINAFQMLLPPHSDFNWSGVFPVSGLFASAFGLEKLSSSGVFAGYETAYYIHLATILGFLIYIPGSKHLHLLAAAPNVFLKRLEREKAIAKTDIEDEDAETFGLGRVNELNRHNVLNLYACTECGRCEELCPAANTGKPLSPKGLIHDIKIDLLNQADRILAGDKEEITPLMAEETGLTQDVLWSCTTCRACEDICPVNNEHLDFIFEMRKHQVLMESSFPKEMQETFVSLENQGNPWGFAADTRADWCRDMDVPKMAEKSKAEVLWFVGCAGSFDDRGKKISQATARVLKKAGVDFAILGAEETCNGDLARRAGNEYLAQMMIQQNIETLAQYEFTTILTGCPHCYNTFKNEYPEFGAQYEVVHTAEFFNRLIRDKRLTVTARDLGTLTFHDSCYMGRWNGIYDAPRQILAQVNTGQLVEMDASGSRGFCCGAGGARMFMEETLGRRINTVRAAQVKESNAEMVASACPFCLTMLHDGMMESVGAIPVKDIAEILEGAIE